MIASCRRHAPLASPISASSGPVTAWTAATRSQVLLGCGTELQLEVVDPAGTLTLHERGHRVGRSERHGDVQRHRLMERSAQQRRDGPAGRSPQDVPARDIQGALRIPVAAQGRVHPFGDSGEVPRIHADERRRELAQRGARALGEGGQVRAPERARLPEPLDTVARPDPHDRAREHVDDPSGRHDVVAVGVREVVAVDVHPVDDVRAVGHVERVLLRDCDGAPRRGLRWRRNHGAASI